MQDGRKAVWSIPYISLAFFQSLKHNFIAYPYLPTPLLEQDTTQGQYLSGV